MGIGSVAFCLRLVGNADGFGKTRRIPELRTNLRLNATPTERRVEGIGSVAFCLRLVGNADGFGKTRRIPELRTNLHLNGDDTHHCTSLFSHTPMGVEKLGVCIGAFG